MIVWLNLKRQYGKTRTEINAEYFVFTVSSKGPYGISEVNQEQFKLGGWTMVLTPVYPQFVYSALYRSRFHCRAHFRQAECQKNLPHP